MALSDHLLARVIELATELVSLDWGLTATAVTQALRLVVAVTAYSFNGSSIIKAAHMTIYAFGALT